MFSLTQVVIFLAPTAVATSILIGVLIYLAMSRTDTEEYRRLAERVRHLEANHVADLAQISKAREEVFYLGRLISLLADMIERAGMVVPPEVSSYLTREYRYGASASDLALLLQQTLRERFDMAELESLAFEIGLELEQIPGSTKDQKVLHLIRHLERRDRLNDLAARVAELRPGAIPWYNARDPP